MIPKDSKIIPGYCQFYRADKQGNIWSCRVVGGVGKGRRGNWRKLRTNVNPKTKYLVVGLMGYPKLVHRLVLEAFLGPCPKGKEARHFPDQSRTNNKLSNLSWATASVNQMDRVANGTSNRGERCGSAVLSWKDVEQIRRLHGRYGYRKLASKFGVAVRTIYDIIKGLTWKVT